MQRLSGTEVSKVHRATLKSRIDELKEKHGRPPGLAVILVGDDPASQVYVAHKGKACQKVGIASWEFRVPAKATEEEVISKIHDLNEKEDVDGILLQLPLPKHMDADKLIGHILPQKDPDCLTPENMGLFWAGRPRVAACTPTGVMSILNHYGHEVAGKKAVVVGRSNIVGKPMALLLTNANATVTLCHSHTRNLRDEIRGADIAVIAAGRPEMFGSDDFKKDSIVVDVGIHRKGAANNGAPKLCGDVRFDELEGHVHAATPVPGGVGPMTIMTLLENTVRLFEERIKH